jgi:hypothetical protein
VRILTAVIASFLVCCALASAHAETKAEGEKNTPTATAAHYVSKAAAEQYARKENIHGICGKAKLWWCNPLSIKITCKRHDGYHSWRCDAKWEEYIISIPPSSYRLCKSELSVYHTQSVKLLTPEPCDR